MNIRNEVLIHLSELKSELTKEQRTKLTKIFQDIETKMQSELPKLRESLDRLPGVLNSLKRQREDFKKISSNVTSYNDNIAKAESAQKIMPGEIKMREDSLALCQTAIIELKNEFALDMHKKKMQVFMLAVTMAKEINDSALESVFTKKLQEEQTKPTFPSDERIAAEEMKKATNHLCQSFETHEGVLYTPKVARFTVSQWTHVYDVVVAEKNSESKFTIQQKREAYQTLHDHAYGNAIDILTQKYKTKLDELNKELEELNKPKSGSSLTENSIFSSNAGDSKAETSENRPTFIS